MEIKNPYFNNPHTLGGESEQLGLVTARWKNKKIRTFQTIYRSESGGRNKNIESTELGSMTIDCEKHGPDIVIYPDKIGERKSG